MIKLGEVGLLTEDVVTLSRFYRALLEIDGECNDPVHQTIISGEVALTVYNDGTAKNNSNNNICLAFTVDDIQRAYERVVSLGALIIEPPKQRPWGAVNMSFLDPDSNTVYLRCLNESL